MQSLKMLRILFSIITLVLVVLLLITMDIRSDHGLLIWIWFFMFLTIITDIVRRIIAKKRQ